VEQLASLEASLNRGGIPTARQLALGYELELRKASLGLFISILLQAVFKLGHLDLAEFE
jgi:hypothetical protein